MQQAAFSSNILFELDTRDGLLYIEPKLQQ